jgi:transcriptional regulator with XRE-family HTH domain
VVRLRVSRVWPSVEGLPEHYSDDRASTGSVVGSLLREWRQRRHRSQLDLASEAGVSTRHLSCVETGKSRPSRELVLLLAEHLEVPLRERNELLFAGGFAPVFSVTDLDAPEMASVRHALTLMLDAHEPWPAIVFHANWDILMANNSALAMVEGVPGHVMEPTMNLVRITFHPDGLAPRILNLGELRAHFIAGLRRQERITANASLGKLIDEVQSYAGTSIESDPELASAGVIPVRMQVDGERIVDRDVPPDRRNRRRRSFYLNQTLV